MSLNQCQSYSIVQKRVLNEIIKEKKKASKINSIFKVDNQESMDPVDIARHCS